MKGTGFQPVRKRSGISAASAAEGCDAQATPCPDGTLLQCSCCAGSEDYSAVRNTAAISRCFGGIQDARETPRAFGARSSAGR
jgi:hypothetical protein